MYYEKLIEGNDNEKTGFVLFQAFSGQYEIC